MAGDWIKVEKATLRKPEVLRLATILKIHPDHAYGLCSRFWCWCDDNLSSGHLPGVTGQQLDMVMGHDGFSSALISVGWLQAREGSLVIPNFNRHLSQSAKSRALAARRQDKHRSRKSNAPSVTKTSPEKRREEERREEEKEEKESPLPPVAETSEASMLAMEFHFRIPGTSKPIISDLTAEFQAKLDWLKAQGRNETEHILACIKDPKRDRTEAKTIGSMWRFWKYCGLEETKHAINRKSDTAPGGGRYEGIEAPIV